MKTGISMTVIFACKLLNLVLLEESSFLVTRFTVVGAFANAGNRLIVSYNCVLPERND